MYKSVDPELFNDEIVDITEIGDIDTIDIEVDSDSHLFYGNGILTHNSISLAEIADFIGFLGTSQDLQTYQSELHYKILKNRIGTGHGNIQKFYMDDRSLRLYDESELNKWIDDASVSQGNRNIAELSQEEEQTTRRRSGNRNSG